MVEEDSDDSSEYSDDEDELGNKVVFFRSHTPKDILLNICFYRLTILK